MPLESPDKLRYSIVIGTTTTILTSTPLGWSEESVARTRTEDNGVNSEITVPLSFVNDGYDLLQPIYAVKGQFALVYLQIDKLDNNWDYQLFYKYRLDFSKCTDKLYEFEVPGIEEGLAVKFEKYKDTEYEVDLPSSNKIFIDYSGASYTDKNTIQCGYGKLGEKGAEDFYVLKGSRSVRSYTDKIAFTDANGLPYETMTFRALKTTTIPIDIFLKLSIEADAYFLESTPKNGNIVIRKHNADFSSPVTITPTSLPVGVAYPFVPTSSSTPANNRIDNFDRTINAQISIVSGEIYSFFYDADVKDYQSVTITEGSNCRIEFNVLTTSAYQNSKLEAFTYEWLIAELLKKIEPTLVGLPVTDYFESRITYPNVKELLSATPCIKNIGKTNETGKLKTTLKDVLESYHKLKCTAIDITGNKMTIMPLEDAYMKADIGDIVANNGELVAANITVMHDTKHQYNKVKVGADTDDREDDDPLIYPFVCEKEFSVEDSLADAELDLVNNFMLDPYQIDKYVRDTNGDSDNKDECKFMVFACSGAACIYSTLQNGESADAVGYNYEFPENINIVTIGTESKLNRIPVFSSTSLIINKSSSKLFSFICSESGTYQISIKMRISTQHGRDDITFMYADINQHGFSVIEASTTSLVGSISIFYIIVSGHLSVGETYSPKIMIRVLQDFQGLDILETDIFIESKNSIYKKHDKPITGFSGDGDTIYNIPLTPKRILQRWQNYLAISLVGKDTKALKFGTTTILNSAITSKCDYEAAEVVENSDLSLTGIAPTFLPALINFDTYNDYDRILADNPYGYYSLVDKKTGRTFKGYVNKTSYSVGANQTQQWELQAKEL